MLPLALTVQMYARFLECAVFVDGVNQPTWIKGWAHLRAWSWYSTYGDSFLRYGDLNGPEYFAAEAWIFTPLALAVVTCWVRVVYQIFRP